MSLFKANRDSLKCFNSSCIQTIRYTRQYLEATAYTMNIMFTQELLNKKILTAKTNIQVVCRRRQTLIDAPKFLNDSYSFELDENHVPGSMLRQVNIQVDQSHVELPASQTGFTLELLNAKDSSPAKDLFEIVPNYGEGLLVASLKLKKKTNPRRNNGTLEYIVIIFAFFVSVLKSFKINEIFSFTKLKATSKYSNSSSLALMKIKIKNTKKKISFEKSQYKVIINHPETYNIDDIIIKLNTLSNSNGTEMNSGKSSVFLIIGPFRDRY